MEYMEILKNIRCYAMFGPEIKNITGFKVFIRMDSKPISEVERNSNQSSSNSNSFVVDYMFLSHFQNKKYVIDTIYLWFLLPSIHYNKIYTILEQF